MFIMKKKIEEIFVKKIAFIAPSYYMLENVKKVLGKESDILVVKGLLSEGVALAKKLVDSGIEVIISRGETAAMIRSAKIQVVVVDVEVTAFDLLRALKKARLRGRKIAAVAFTQMTEHIKMLAESLNLDIDLYVLHKEQDAEQIVSLAVGEGADVVLGGVITGEAANKQNCLFEIIESGSEGIKQAVREAVAAMQAKLLEREKSALLSTVIDYAYEGIIAVNTKGEITVFNPMAEKLTGFLREDVIGLEIKKVLPILQLEKILANKNEIFGSIIKLHEKNIVCNLTPIKTDIGISGAVATFMDAGTVQQMEERVRAKLFTTGHVATKTQKDIIGESVLIKKAIYKAKQYALTQSSVLIFGETGSGKEVFAQTIHNYSDRKNRAFVAINCAALPGQLLESELFGYEPGAFTGASQKGKPGLFEIAHGGTVFLDEIAEMDIVVQSKLLRVLEERKVMRLGSDRLLPVDVRIIAASNKDLKQCVKTQQFRQDLYYRLNVLKLDLPSLKERKEDIRYLCEHFLEQNISRPNFPKLSKSALKVLASYDWPGNVRELQNILQRLSVVYITDNITESDVREVLQEDLEDFRKQIVLTDEQSLIKDALVKSDWHYGKASELLGMHRTTLWRKMKKYGMVD